MRSEAGFLRAGILVVAWLSLLGTGVELALERHWQSLEQGIAWIAVALAVASATFATRRSSGGRLWLARLLAVAVLALSVVGVWRHVNANYEAGELDAEYGPRWAAMTETDRWRAAALKSVGPAPILASGMLASVSMLVLLATVGRPRQAVEDDAEGYEEEPPALSGSDAEPSEYGEHI